MPPRKKSTLANAVVQAKRNIAKANEAFDKAIDDAMSWGDDEWLPPQDRVSGQDLENLWESAPNVSRAFTTFKDGDNHTFVMVDRPESLDYQDNLEYTIVALRADREAVRKSVHDGIAIIEGLRKQLAEARKPDETEALAALREDTARVHARQRDEIKALKDQVKEQTDRAAALQRQLDQRSYQFNDMHRTARRLADSLSALTVVEPPPPSPRLTGVMGQAQRAIEDSLIGTPPTSPSKTVDSEAPRPLPGTPGFCFLEID